MDDATRLAAWRAGLTGRRDRLGWLLMVTGTTVLVAALPCSIALQNIGFAALATGAVLARCPVLRRVEVLIGACFAGWILVSILSWQIAGADGIARTWRPEGMSYTWLAAPLTLPVWSDPVLRRRLGLLLAAVIASSALLAWTQVAVGHGGPGPFRILSGGERLGSGWYNEYLTHGAIAGMTLLALAALSQRSGATAAGLATVATLARGALLGLVAGAAAAWAARGRHHTLQVAVGLVLAAGLALAALGALRPDKLDRMLRGEDGRWVLWANATAIIADHPLVGAGGMAAYRACDQAIHPRLHGDLPPEFPRGAPHAHNSLLALAGERGIPAALLWCALLATLVARCWHSTPTARALALGLAASALAGGLTERLAGDVETSYALFTFLGLALALAQPTPKPTPAAAPINA
jgi:O-antigen ligase